MKNYHFDLGNSSVGPIGLCARIKAQDKPSAAERLRELLPEHIPVHVELRPGESIDIYLNPDAVGVDDITEIDDDIDNVEVKIQTEDGYVFMRRPDGRWSDGDMEFISIEDLAKSAGFDVIKGHIPLEDLHALWQSGKDVPISDEGYIEEPWAGFPDGTFREEIWRWFEKQNPQFVVGSLLKGGTKNEG